jgi:SAM-dependent MidA family methyltransferase
VTAPLVRLIAERGAVRFDDYMDLALYHPEFGYYARGMPRTGFAGHFVTSPELTPAFGALWARAFEAAWRACDEPDEFVVTEIGAGEGGFAAAISSLATDRFAAALRIRIVERVPELRERQRRLVPDATWVGALDELQPVEHGAFFANEVLDNVPVRVVEGSPDGPREVWVEAQGDRLVEVTRPAEDDVAGFLRHIDATLEPAARFEVPEAAAAFVRRAAATVVRGAIFFVDYGDSTKGLLERPLGSLLCYSESGVDDRPLERPGEKDITVHANWNVVIGELMQAGWQVAAPTKQRTFLEALGARELTSAYKEAHEEALREGRGADAVRALSGRTAIAGLLDEGGLGGLDVVAAFRGNSPPTGRPR